MQVNTTGVRSVDALYGVDFTGNIIPHSWYSTIQTKAGKPDLTAITILSEILYWHRPREECDESDSGRVTISKRFKADQLQLSYKQLNMKFGLSKNQSRRAMDKLEKLGLIKRHFKTVMTQSGDKLGNVMYVELFADRLIEMTYPGEAATPYMKKPMRVSDKTDEGIGKNQQGSVKKPMTNTKNTSEITSKDHNSIYQVEVERVRERVDYEVLVRDMKADRGLIDEMISIIAETNLYAEDPQWINGCLIPAQVVRERLKNANCYVMKEVLDSMRSAPRDVVNMRGYILTALFNASSTYQLGLDMEVTRDMYRKEARAWGA